MKKYISLFLCAAFCLGALTGCQEPAPEPGIQKYSYQFFGTFDTVIQLVGYTQSKEEFDEYALYTRERFETLHRLFDRYYTYDGVNNVKTINDNAGKEPVRVGDELLGLLDFGVAWHGRSGGALNIAMGSVLTLWQRAIDQYRHADKDAALPNRIDMVMASLHVNIENVVIDRAARTVYLTDPDMLLDVGAVAKGYATELVARELEAKGLTAFSINAGGNVRTGGKPLDEQRAHWSVGIQDPNSDPMDPEEKPLDTVYVNNLSVVSSGDYQRYYMLQTIRIHHIIDPATLMPGTRYRQVTVIHRDSGLADVLSTALFLMEQEEGEALASQFGAGVMWYDAGGGVTVNDTYKAVSQVYGDPKS